MTGSYPWKISKDFTTVVYITNISDQRAEFVTQINYEGGKYVINPHSLGPGETAVFDLRRIRDEQNGDNVGRKLPKEMSLGQFKWAVRGSTKGKQVLIGRAEMVSLSQRVSTSYSCNDPCPPYYGADMYPMPPIVVLGSASTSIWETAYYDTGLSLGPYQISASFTLDAPVGTLDPASGHSTSITGTDVGVATLDGFVGTHDRWSWDGRDCYWAGTYDEGDTEPVEVQPTINGPRNVWWFNGENPTGYATEITLTASAASGPYSWAVVSGGTKSGYLPLPDPRSGSPASRRASSVR